MVYNSFIRCQVCQKVTRIRLQVGWQSEHPIVVACKECGTSLCGRVLLGQESPSINLSFDNADILADEDSADYMVECSGEFPTTKNCVAQPTEVVLLSPFMRAMDCMKNDEAYEEFCKSIGRLKETKEKWKDYKRVFTLFQNNSEYLVQEIQKILHGQYFECRDEYEVYRAVHMIEVIGFYSPLRHDLLNDLSFSEGIRKLDRIELEKLVSFLEAHEGYHLSEIQNRLYKLYEEFIDIYQALVPAILLQYCEEDAFDFETEGVTTSTFDTIKQFSLDVYETVADLLVIPIGLNNIKYRSAVSDMAPIDAKVTTLDEFIALSKAKKYHYCVQNEDYSSFLGAKPNSKLRNAIGHNDVEYDTISQKITYIPDPKDRTRKLQEYLLEYENETVHMFQAALAISEYLYRLRQLKLNYDGVVPLPPVDYSNVGRKIYPNEKCPCGSGKKYKYCHGKINK